MKWPIRRAHPSLLVPKTSVVTTTERTFVIRNQGGRAEWVKGRMANPERQRGGGPSSTPSLTLGVRQKQGAHAPARRVRGGGSMRVLSAWVVAAGERWR